MSKNNLNQRNKIEDFLFKSKFDYENQPINRLKKVEIIENKQELLKKLKLKIENLEDCEPVSYTHLTLPTSQYV